MSTPGQRIKRPADPGPITRIAWRLARRQVGGELPEPVAVMGHHPKLMHGYAALELALEHSKRVPRRLKHLAELKAAAVCGCAWCMDFGSSLSAELGLDEEQMRELPRFRESERFSEDEKLVLEYGEAVTRTPVDVPEELFARLRDRFDEGQIVELTFAIAIENLRARFNWALAIGSQGYSDGAFCIRPETLPGAAAPARSAAES
jgi:AhpD family alkylhydroperoxidase